MLPLHQKKKPKILPAKPIEEKLINGSATDEIHDQCAVELMESAASKDIPGFRAALRALIMNHKEESQNGE